VVRDMIEVLTSMWGARNRAMRAVTAAKQIEVVADG
jgi:hypothetical protein